MVGFKAKQKISEPCGGDRCVVMIQVGEGEGLRVGKVETGVKDMPLLVNKIGLWSEDSPPSV